MLFHVELTIVGVWFAAVVLTGLCFNRLRHHGFDAVIRYSRHRGGNLVSLVAVLAFLTSHQAVLHATLLTVCLLSLSPILLDLWKNPDLSAPVPAF